MTLTTEELKALDQLEDEQGRGDAVSWDEPKTVRGIVVRDVETITYTDKNDGLEKSKKVVTLRTEAGLEAIYEGPVKLNGRLFEGERYKQASLGPPRKGEFVVVRYKGERSSQTTGRPVKDFDVFRKSEPPILAGEPIPVGTDDIPW